MSISYLSQPLKSTVEPYKENIELIAQVASMKQSKYDNVLDNIFQKQDQLLDIDVSLGSEEASNKKNNLLTQVDKKVNSFASLDLLNPYNIQQIEGVFDPILKDEDIINAASITSHTKDQLSYFDKWKKEGKGLYDSKNEDYFLRQVAENKKMTLDDVKKKGYNQALATEFVDIDKLYDDAVENLFPDVTSVVSPDEEGRIWYQNGKILSKEKVLAKLPINSKIIAQAEINAFYSLGDASSNELLLSQRNNILEYKKQNNIEKERESEIIKQQETFYNNIKNDDSSVSQLLNSPNFDKESYLKELKTQIDEGKKILNEYQDRENKYNDELSKHEKTYGFVNGVYTKELGKNELTNLRTSVWLNEKNNQYADAIAYRENTFKVEYDQIYLKNLEHFNNLEEEKAKLENDKALKKFEAQLGQTYGTSGDSNLSKVGDEIKVNEFGIRTSDVIENKFKLEDGNEYQSLKRHYGEVITAQNNLINQTLKTYRSLTGNNSISKEKLLEAATLVTTRLSEYNKLSDDEKATATIPGEGNITYQQYFNLDLTRRLLDYNQRMSEYNNEREANKLILKDIEEDAFNQLGINFSEPLKVNLHIPVWWGGRSDFRNQEITIPPKYIKKFISKTLTLEEIKEIMPKIVITDADTRVNPTFLETTDSFYKAAATNPLSSEMKLITQFKNNTNEISKKYQEGNLVNSYFIKDNNSKNGKAMSDYLKSFINTTVKTGNESIILNDLKKKDGEWFVYYQTKSDKEIIKNQDPLKISTQIQDDLGLDLIQDVSYVQKSIEKQLKGNSTAIPKVNYSYLGNNFIITKSGNMYYVYNQGSGVINTPAIAYDENISTILSAIKLKYKL